MHLLVIYIIVITIGEILAFFLGRAVEGVWPGPSMLIYMAMFFGVLWGGWPLAVHLNDRWERGASQARKA